MVSRLALVTVFGALSLGSAAFVVGCSSDDGDTQGNEDDIKKKKLGDEGALCDAASKCKTGLLCKQDSSGPPPGAVGMPLPPGSASSSGGPPPGAMGLPIQPKSHCAKPGPGEEGGSCSSAVPCQSGLKCDYGSSSNGPPPGAVGLPLPPGSASSSGGPPPGAMGMPLLPSGTCKSSSAPPPGAVGMPLPPK